MVKVKLFQQKPKTEKFKPLPITRAVSSIDLDRKEELEKFRRWLEGTSKKKVKLPNKKELDNLNKEVKSGRANKFGLLGILGAIPLVGPLLGIAGGGLATLATGAIGAIGGGLLTAGGLAIGGGLKLFGLGGAAALGGTRLLGKAGQKLFGGGKKGPANNIRTGPRSGSRGGASPGVKPQTSATPNRPASSPSRSTAAGNQNRGGGQQYRNNLNRSQSPAATTQPKKPSLRAKLGSQMETGTAFGGKGSAAQKKLFKLQQRMKKLFSGKNPLQGFLSKMFGTKAGRKGIGAFLKRFVTKIPFIGALIDFALQVFVFKEHPGRAAFKAIGAGLGMWIGGGVGAFLGGGFASWITAPIGAFLGGAGGDAFGAWVYDSIFGTPSASASAPDPKDEGNILDQIFGQDEEPPAPELPTATGETPAVPLKGLMPTGTGSLKDVVSVDAMTGKSDPGGPIMTSGRGMRGGRHHAGIDIGTGHQRGWYVSFRLSGRVSLVQYLSGYGNTVIIEAGGRDFLFAHLARKSDLKIGQAYNGEIIGEIGNTGVGTGEHLHFEVRSVGGGTGTDMDPMPFVKHLVIGRLDPNANESSTVDTVNPGSETPQIPAQLPEEKQQQERPKSFVEQLTEMLPESAKGAMSSIIESFKIFGYMADKELMDSLVVNPDGSVSKKAVEPTDGLDAFRQGMDMSDIKLPMKDLSVEMLSPEAEAALNNSIIMMMGQPPAQSMGGGGGSPIAVAPQQPQQPVIVLGGSQDALAAVKLLQAHALS